MNASDADALMDARERAERRAEKAAHRAALASERRQNVEFVAELREAWKSVASGGGGGAVANSLDDEAAELCGADVERVFVALGMRGTDTRGLLPGAPRILRSFAGWTPPMNFGRFCTLAMMRRVDYDGPSCSLCHSITSSEPEWEGRLECERETGVCSVFADAIGAKRGSDVIANDCVASSVFEGAVLDCLCMSAGIDPRRRRASGDDQSSGAADLAVKATRIVEAARAAIGKSAAGGDLVTTKSTSITVADAQRHLEEAALSI